MKIYQVDGDVVSLGEKELVFQPIEGPLLTLLVSRKIKKKLPPPPRLCRLEHDGVQVVRLEAFYLG